MYEIDDNIKYDHEEPTGGYYIRPVGEAGWRAPIDYGSGAIFLGEVPEDQIEQVNSWWNAEYRRHLKSEEQLSEAFEEQL